MPPGAEGGREHLADMGGDGGMRAALGLADDERAIEELEAFAREHAEVHEALVLDPTPPAGLHAWLDRRRHGDTVAKGGRTVNVPATILRR